MKSHLLPSLRRGTRGSAFITVLLFTFILFLLVGSVITWSVTERRLNMRNAYWLEARNAAEAVAEYGFSQIVTRYNNYATPPTLSPGGSNPISLPPSSFFTGGNVVTSAYSSTNPNGLEVIAGAEVTVPAGGSLYYVDPNNPDNQADTLKSQYVARRDIQVLAKATVVPPFGRPITAYVTEKVSIRGAPLFAHAIFYSNNDLEASPGPTLDVYGPVHVNGNMFPLAQGTVETGTANAVNFHGPVSITGDLYHAWGNQHAPAQGRGYSSSSATLDGEPVGNDPVTFVNNANAQVNLNASGTWKDSTMGTETALLTSLGRYVDTGTAAITQLQAKLSSDFRSYASQTWNGNLQTSAMGVQSYNPIAFTQAIDSAGTLPDPHAIIDAPNTSLSSTDPYYTAKHEVETQKLANQTGLYVQVTVTPGSAGAADTGTITLYGPPGSWDSSGSTDTTLKGPNGGIKLGTAPSSLVTFIPFQAVATGTAATPATQTSYSVSKVGSVYKIVTTTKTGGTLSQTATATYNGTSADPAVSVSGSGSFSGGSSSTSTGSTSYATSAAATAALPATTTTATGSASVSIATSTANVSSGLYDQRQLAGINVVQVDMSALRAALNDANSNANSDHLAITTSSGTVWGVGTNGWNGGVYVGITSSSGGTYPGQTSVVVANGQVSSGSSLLPTTNSVSGLMLATNGPMYVAGNFNADGSNATTAASATTPDDGRTNAIGTSTSAEVPIALAADAISILSGNYFGTAGTNGSSVSATNGSTTSAYKSFNTSSPSASGSVEIASAFITGIVGTTDSTFSGGVHNLPRFLENWGSNAVAIRGSLVSLFKSNVATDGWAQRYYSAPKRIWGFDQIFSNGTFPPLTPKVMSYRRVDFSDLSSTDYQTARHTLWPGLY